MQSFMYAVNFDDTEERKKKSSVRVKGRVNHCNFQTGKYACSRFREIWGRGNTFVYSGLFSPISCRLLQSADLRSWLIPSGSEPERKSHFISVLKQQ